MEIIHARPMEKLGYIDEIQYLKNFEKFNMVISQEPQADKNDFELKLATSEWLRLPIKENDWLYVPNTEWVGEVKGIEHINDIVKITGLNARGRTANRIITPRPQKDSNDKWNGRFEEYLNISKDANEYLKTLYLLNYGMWGGTDYTTDKFMAISTNLTGVIIEDQIRFDNFLERVTSKLDENDMRFMIKHTYDRNELQLCEMSAEKKIDYSDGTYINKDYDLEITSKIDHSKRRRYCFCLWKGELEERDCKLLHMDNYGIISERDPFWDGIDCLSNSIFYDNANAETVEELIEGGKKRLTEEYNSKKTIEITVKNNKIEFYLGDKIGGTDEITGVSGSQRIIEKELTIDGNGERIDYRLSE